MEGCCEVCLEETKHPIGISSNEGKDLDISTILITHFPKIFTEPPENGLMCPSCWSKLNTFHEFYNVVEAIHMSKLNQINSIVKAEPLDIIEEVNVEETVLQEVFNTSVDHDDSDDKGHADDEYFPNPAEDLSDHSDTSSSVSEPKPERRRSKRTKSDDEWKPKTSRRCEDCQITFPSAALYVKHMKLAHPLPHKCAKMPCDQSFATEEELKEHDDEFHTRQKCPQCSRVMYKHYIAGHIEKDHARLLCNSCGAVFPNKSSLASHWRNVHKVDPVKCVCGKWFDNKRLLNQHKRVEHRPNYGPKDCPKCGKTISQSSVMARHMRLHTEEGRRKYMCEQCGKGYPRKTALQEHMSVHTGINLYKCSTCEQTFQYSAGYSVHRKKCRPYRPSVIESMSDNDS